jgi:chromosome segregation ATPase
LTLFRQTKNMHRLVIGIVVCMDLVALTVQLHTTLNDEQNVLARAERAIAEANDALNKIQGNAGKVNSQSYNVMNKPVNTLQSDQTVLAQVETAISAASQALKQIRALENSQNTLDNNEPENDDEFDNVLAKIQSSPPLVFTKVNVPNLVAQINAIEQEIQTYIANLTSQLSRANAQIQTLTQQLATSRQQAATCKKAVSNAQSALQQAITVLSQA